jgi:two-component system nitrogen regulation response regulator NtrX
VRELRNIIERLMIMVPGEVITGADLPFIAPDAAKRAPAGRPNDVAPLYAARDAWERDYILNALAVLDGNISRAAETLGVERSNLYRKMRALGISAGKREGDESAES